MSNVPHSLETLKSIYAKPQPIEAHGVKGMKSTPWRRVFKSADALNRWVEKTGAEVYAVRDVE